LGVVVGDPSTPHLLLKKKIGELPVYLTYAFGKKFVFKISKIYFEFKIDFIFIIKKN